MRSYCVADVRAVIVDIRAAVSGRVLVCRLGKEVQVPATCRIQEEEATLHRALDPAEEGIVKEEKVVHFN